MPNPWLTSCTCAQVHEEGHNDLMLSENQILNVLDRFVQSFARKAGFDTNELTIVILQLVSCFHKMAAPRMTTTYPISQLDNLDFLPPACYKPSTTQPQPGAKYTPPPPEYLQSCRAPVEPPTMVVRSPGKLNCLLVY